MNDSWVIIALIFVFSAGNIGSIYALIQRVTNPELLKAFIPNFGTKNEINLSTLEQTLKNNHQAYADMLQKTQNEITQKFGIAMSGFENLQGLILRGSVVKIDELIETRYREKIAEIEKREQKLLEAVEVIKNTNFGQVIKKP